MGTGMFMQEGLTPKQGKGCLLAGRKFANGQTAGFMIWLAKTTDTGMFTYRNHDMEPKF